MINYCIEIFIYQALFIGLYQLLKSEPLFKINRIYLLLSLSISLILPVISFGNLNPIIINDSYAQWLQPININTQSIDNTEAIMSNLSNTPSFSWNYFDLLYGFGLLTYSLWFIIRNRSIFKYLKHSSHSTYNGKNVVFLPNSSTAFSFCNRIYLGEDVPESQREVILEHEYQHLKLKHSWDMMVLELLQFILWFNPLIYIYKRHLRQVHEFEADHLATQNTSKKAYVNTLLNQCFDCQNISFVNSFYHSSNLKKRISMLHKSKFNRLKYLLILPVLSLAILISCAEENEVDQELTQEEQKADIKNFNQILLNKDSNIFDKLENKPDLKTLLNSYEIDIKDEYSEHEEGKIALVMGFIKFSSEYRNDKAYQSQIDREINQSKGLKKAAKKLEEYMSNRNEREVTEVQELDPNSDIPFALLDRVPHPESCKDFSGDELKKCVSKFIATHVNKNFNTDLGSELGLSGKVRIVAQFKIDKNGDIVDVKTRAPHPKLEKEAVRILESLPKMIPGSVNGENVNVLYGLPINFMVQ